MGCVLFVFVLGGELGEEFYHHVDQRRQTCVQLCRIAKYEDVLCHTGMFIKLLSDHAHCLCKLDVV